MNSALSAFFAAVLAAGVSISRVEFSTDDAPVTVAVADSGFAEPDAGQFAETDSVQPEPGSDQETSRGEGDQGLPDVSPEALGKGVFVLGAFDEASDIVGDARLAELPVEEVREAVLLGILRVADPGLRVLSRGEWDAERDSAEIDLADAVSVEDFPAHIGYAKVVSLVPGAGKSIAEAIRRWDDDGFHGAILDLRGAGGGDEDSVLPIASLFAASSRSEDARLVFTVIRDGRMFQRNRSAVGRCSMPVVALVDEGTRGAAELLAAVLKGACKETLLVGETTAADPCIRLPHDLPNDRVALVAVAKIVMADGTEYTGATGVIPDIVLAPSDRVLEVAESHNPISMRRVKRGELEEEREDRALRERIGSDGFLIHAVDIIQGLRAIAP